MPGIETIRRPSSVIINTRTQEPFLRNISFDVRKSDVLMKVASFQKILFLPNFKGKVPNT